VFGKLSDDYDVHSVCLLLNFCVSLMLPAVYINLQKLTNPHLFCFNYHLCWWTWWIIPVVCTQLFWAAGHL